jgi:putative FmdB family regulatory protein
MPLYEYRCGKCGRKMEVIQNLSEKPLKICPHCGERALKKLMSAPAIQFKGSGWYVTDYAGKKSDGSAKSGRSDDSSGEKSSVAREPKAEKVEKSEKSEMGEKAPKKGGKKD